MSVPSPAETATPAASRGYVDRGLLPRATSEQEYRAYETAVQQLLATLSRELDELIDREFPQPFDLWALANQIEKTFPTYQNVPFKRLDPQFMENERKIDCVGTAYTLARKWKQAQPGNSAVYFIQGKMDEDGAVEVAKKDKSLKIEKEEKSASQAHVIIALLPAEVPPAQVYVEYEKFLAGKDTVVKFVHYDFRARDQELYSRVIPLEPTLCDLRNFIRIDSDEELLRHRIKVYFAQNERNNKLIHELTFGTQKTANP